MDVLNYEFKNPTENQVMMQEWVNKFFEAHKLDKKTSIQTVFTD
jgi:hypothetical protein